MNTEQLHAALPRLEESLRSLRDFQRRTVDHVFQRMYTDAAPTTRFLVADEVGLGKTKIAQGLIARALQHLHEKIERIDVVYVCSNAAIARQNLNRLNPLPGLGFSFATRLTLLPLELRGLRRNRVNMVSFTPGTAIDTSGGGVWQERVILYWMLQRGLSDVVGSTGTPLRNLLQATIADPERWAALLRDNKFEAVGGDDGAPEGKAYDAALADRFCKAVRADREVIKLLGDGLERFSHLRKHIPAEDNRVRYDVIGRLRGKLARVCVDELEPDIVILDEFQRFQDLLEGESEAAEIARALFDYEDPKGNLARVLLLSATPYRPLTLSDEEEDHHSGFLKTFRFLTHENENELAGLKSELERHRHALSASGEAGLDPHATAASIRARLLKTMCRTERVALTERQDAMVREVAIEAPLTPSGVRTGVAIDRVAGALGKSNPVEYWKSAPYALSFMRDYELKEALRESSNRPSEPLLKALDANASLLLRRDEVRQWRALDIDHGRIRSLADETLGKGLWRLLWLPPSLPYVAPSGPYAHVGPTTKALIFSCWNVVPDSVAAVLSYEAERLMIAESSVDAGPYDATESRRRPLLTFRIDREGDAPRAGAMMTLALLYPSVTLATTIDPLEIACAEAAPVPLEQMRAVVRERFARLVDEKVERFGRTTGPVDQRWYWALPALLDVPHMRLLEWLDEGEGAIDEEKEHLFFEEAEEHRRFSELFDEGDSDATERDEGFRLHVNELRELVLAAKRGGGRNGAKLLGRAPDDLVETLADLAIASPAVCALRALLRVTRSRIEKDNWSLLTASAEIARGFRTLFNVPESIALLRAGAAEADEERIPYWRRVLEYCCDGNLQAVLDELVHLKIDDTGTRDKAPSVQVHDIAHEIAEALSPRTSHVTVDDVKAMPRAGRIEIDKFPMRCRFAMRYGDIRDDRDGATARASVVKSAFNSPFRPFVLATTSIGQEGLDFHHYCHCVYHWNLPSNPVDLEQREGRVHRYKGHAVRRNVALRFGIKGVADHWDGASEDPWDCLFRLASQTRAPGLSEVVPFWIYETPGGVSVERRVPMLPLSREHADLEGLKRDLATYRLVFGQPRQEDLMALLQRRGVQDEPGLAGRWRIDLTPPTGSSGNAE